MRTFSLIAVAGILLSGSALAQSPAVTPLVDAEWLVENKNNDNVVVIDIRDDIEKTNLGAQPYIENAVVAPYASAGWRTEIDGVPGMTPPIDQLTTLIEGLGVDDDDHVVIVPWGTDSSEFGGATRVYWTFKYLGHDAVSILDGGWRQYEAAGGPRSESAAEAEVGEFTADVQDDLIATTDEVAAALEAGVTLVDGRPAEQYRGESKSPVVRLEGTIPGAVNIQHSDLYSAEYALFARPETVEALATAVGLGSDDENIAFCNTGHWASIAWFGLSEVMGNKNTSMYDGSMAEWTADDARPVDDKTGS